MVQESFNLKSRLSQLAQKPLFWLGLSLKLLLGSLFASDYYAELFIPFLNAFTSNGFQDPYQLYWQIGRPEMFPYPALMLYIMALPGILMNALTEPGHAITWLDLLVYRLPILAADVTILVVLSGWIKQKLNSVLLFYWLSPILLYISYIHGQLDVIPVAILFLAADFQFRGKLWLASLLYGFCIATKTNMVIAIPFYLLYLYTLRIGLKRVGQHLLFITCLFILVNLPFATSEGFRQMVFNNREQFKLFYLHLDFGLGLSLFIVPTAYLLTLARAMAFKFFNRDLYIMFLGFTFGLLVVLIPPMQGWYYWVIPFLTYFLLRHQYNGLRARVANFTLILVFFLYFLMVPASDFFDVFQITNPELATIPNLNQLLVLQGFNTDRLIDIAFTLLQVTLGLNCALIYQYGVQNTMSHKIFYKPYMIGVGGDSGSGKSTYTKLIMDLFGSANLAVVRGDDMHRWERGHEEWKRITHLDPKANHLHNDLAHALNLKQGRSIARRHYDHQDGRFTMPVTIASNRVVLFEGLHPFYLSNTRSIFDCKVFIDPDQELRNHWKIVRDMDARGYSKEEILAQIEARAQDAQKYIQVQSKYADLIFSFKPLDPIQDMGNLALKPRLALHCVLNNNINLDGLTTALGGIRTLGLKHFYRDENYQVLELNGTITSEELSQIISSEVPEIEEVIGGWPVLEEGYNGLLQLVTAYYVFNQIENG